MTPPAAKAGRKADAETGAGKALAANIKIEVIIDSFVEKVEGHPVDTWWTHEVTGILEDVRKEIVAALEATSLEDTKKVRDELEAAENAWQEALEMDYSNAQNHMTVENRIRLLRAEIVRMKNFYHKRVFDLSPPTDSTKEAVTE